MQDQIRGKNSTPAEPTKCFNGVIGADYLYSASLWGEKSLHCAIAEESFVFRCSDGTTIGKRRIQIIFFGEDRLCNYRNITSSPTIQFQHFPLFLYQKSASPSIRRALFSFPVILVSIRRILPADRGISARSFTSCSFADIL